MASNSQSHNFKVSMLEHPSSKSNDPVLLQDQFIVYPLLSHHAPQLLCTLGRSNTTSRPNRGNSWHHLVGLFHLKDLNGNEELTHTWSLGFSGISVFEACGGATKSLCLWYFHRLRIVLFIGWDALSEHLDKHWEEERSLILCVEECWTSLERGTSCIDIFWNKPGASVNRKS